MRWKWIAVIGGPVLAAVIAWLWADATVSTAVCRGGGTPGQKLGWPSTTGVLLLCVIGPIATAAYARRAERPPVLIAMSLASAAVAVILVSFSLDVWWVGHGCYD